jgi:hypothetical protein
MPAITTRVKTGFRVSPSAYRHTPSNTNIHPTSNGPGDINDPKKGPHVDPHPPCSRPRGGVDAVRGEQGVIYGACHPGSEVPALRQVTLHTPIESILGCWV